MRLHKYLLAGLVTAVFAMPSIASADIVTFVFFSGNDFGGAIDSDFTATQNGITFVASAAGPGAEPNVGTSGIGVNSTVAGDSATQIDPGETLTLAINFDPAAFLKVQLTEVDLGNVGDPLDGANVTFPDSTTVTYLDGATAPAGFTFTDGTPDLITAVTPIDLVTGDTLVFDTPAGTTGEFRLQRIRLHLEPVVVPEPTSLGLLGLLGLGIVTRRRR